jgi:hypothetical protein
VTSLPEGFNPTVGGYLDLSSVTSLPDGFNPTVGGDLHLSSVTSLPDGFNPTVGGYLHLSSVTSLPDGFNPTVGGDLHLSSVTSLPDGFNPTVGGNLYLYSVTSLPDGWKKSDYERKRIPIMYWQGGRYMQADGVMGEVVSRRKNVWKLKKLGSDNIFYCVSDASGRFAHGDTVKAAKADLIYKLTEDANKEEFAGLKLTDVLPFEKCIQLYRVTTGACSFGVRNFIESHGIEDRSYTVSEILEKTNGQYGSESLSTFFGVTK